MDRKITVFVIIALAIAGCGGPTEEAITDPDDTPDVALAPCELEGYPCTFNDVPTEVTEQSLALAAQALRQASTDGVDAALAWLSNQPQVVEAHVSGNTIWLRLEGGRPVYAVDHGTVAPPVVATTATADPLTPQHVTGRDRNDDGKINNRDQRYALVLSPLSLPYGWAEGAAVVNALNAHPAYEGKVSLHLGMAADRAAFASLRKHDVVHIVTDAKRRCAPGGSPETCRTYLALGEVADPAAALVGDGLNEPGLVYGVHRANGEAHYHLAASDVWFARALGEKQARIMVFLSAGAGQNETDLRRLGNAILGPDLHAVHSRMLSWGGEIDRSRAELNAEFAALVGEFYTYATSYGTTSEEAKLLAGIHPVAIDADEEGIRIREVVTLLNPTTEEPLQDGERYTRWLKGELDDAEPDDIRVAFLVEGMLEGAVPFFTVTLNGESTSVVDVDHVAEGPYRFVKVARLRVDPLESGRTYELEVIIELPEGGESRYVADATFPSCWFDVSVAGAIDARFVASNATQDLTEFGVVEGYPPTGGSLSDGMNRISIEGPFYGDQLDLILGANNSGDVAFPPGATGDFNVYSSINVERWSENGYGGQVFAVMRGTGDPDAIVTLERHDDVVSGSFQTSGIAFNDEGEEFIEYGPVTVTGTFRGRNDSCF